mmetsp:Transcript_8105/g.20740  ORF Transcript_8105/g.20740 Transcript_8105/m.20740 type:complete len:110 (-) Transcript_8105:175-504(-)
MSAGQDAAVGVAASVDGGPDLEDGKNEEIARLRKLCTLQRKEMTDTRAELADLKSHLSTMQAAFAAEIAQFQQVMTAGLAAAAAQPPPAAADGKTESTADPFSTDDAAL